MLVCQINFQARGPVNGRLPMNGISNDCATVSLQKIPIRALFAMHTFQEKISDLIGVMKYPK